MDFSDNFVSWGANDGREVGYDVSEQDFCFLRGGHGSLGKGRGVGTRGNYFE